MKWIAQILVLAFVVALTAGFVQAQNNTEIKHGIAYALYDKAANETTLEVRRLEVINTADRWIFVNASTQFAGQTLPKRPADVTFIIQVGSPGGYKYPDQIKLKLKFDGKDQTELSMRTLDRRMAGTMYLETIGVRMNIELFAKLSKARSVEMQLDTTSFTIGTTHLQKLADLDRLMTP